MVEKKREVIDSHHHLWNYDPVDYSWIGGNMRALQRDFLPADLQKESDDAKVDGTVAVQARQTLEETDWLLSLAEKSSLIRGVVGWAPIASRTFPAVLESLKSNSKLKGLRHVIQGEPDDNFINREDFNRGIKELGGTKLIYDILIFEKHLPPTIEFVDRHPNQIFVLDHCAKPRIGDGILVPWKQNIFEIAKRQNVYCKLSGLVTEAAWSTWAETDLKPFADVVFEAFTPARLMFGSDWPVCLLAVTYQRWFDCVQSMVQQLTVNERDKVLGTTAIEVYGL